MKFLKARRTARNVFEAPNRKKNPNDMRFTARSRRRRTTRRMRRSALSLNGQRAAGSSLASTTSMNRRGPTRGEYQLAVARQMILNCLNKGLREIALLL